MKQQSQKVGWGKVLFFFVIACAWSWPLFWWRDMHWESWMAWRIPMPLKNTLLMWGPGIAALLCLRMFRGSHQRRIVVFGSSRWRSLVFYFVPVFALAAVGVKSGELGQGTAHALVLLIGVIGLVNVLGEELGWRGFLQDALRPLPRTARYVLIGLMWTGWHFTNLFAHREGAALWTYLAWYVPSTIALSIVIGEASDRSRAVLVAVTLHAWMNLVLEFPGVGTHAVLALAIPFWGWMLWKWPDAAEPVVAATVDGRTPVVEGNP